VGVVKALTKDDRRTLDQQGFDTVSLKPFQLPCCADDHQKGCNKGLASVFPCGKWHLLFLISDVIHLQD